MLHQILEERKELYMSFRIWFDQIELGYSVVQHIEDHISRHKGNAIFLNQLFCEC